jgi:hypothetical protein
MSLRSNHLGFKFGSQFISQLVEAQEIAKQEAMDLISSSAANGELGNQNL